MRHQAFRSAQWGRVAILWCAALALGCGGRAAEAPPTSPNSIERSTGAPAAPVRLVVVDNEQLARNLGRSWQTLGQGELQVTHLTAAELRHAGPQADAILFPAYLLGELAERRQILPLDRPWGKQLSELRTAAFPLARAAETNWGEATYALSLGAPYPVLLVRRDLLDELQASVPQTWGEYQVLAARLAAHQKSAGNETDTWSAGAEPLAPGSAALLLLARAAAYARHANQYSALFEYQTLEPLIDGPPFVKALEELVAAARLGPANWRELSPARVQELFLTGRCGLAVAWPGAAAERGTVEPVSFAVTVAALPGAREVYRLSEKKWEARAERDEFRVPLVGGVGRLAGVCAGSRSPGAAFALIARLAEGGGAGTLTARGVAEGPFREDHARQAVHWIDQRLTPAAAREAFEALRHTHHSGVWLPALRLPGHQEYLQCLEGAIYRALEGQQQAAESLAQCAEEWREISRRIGLAAQTAAYQKSLGLEP